MNDFSLAYAGALATPTKQQPAFVTYSIETKASIASATGVIKEQSRAFLDSFQALSAEEVSRAKAAFGQWDAASGITFLEVPAGMGDLKLGKFDLTLGGPDPSGRNAAAYVYDDAVYISTSASATTQILLHEIGHFIGLKHPFSGEFTLDPSLDNWSQTVMSYTSGGYSGDVLGVLDKAAISNLYGDGARDGSQVASWSWDATTSTLTQQGFSTATVMRGVGGNNNISGGAGADSITIIAGNGRNVIDAGAGNDAIVTMGAGGFADVRAGDGNDYMVISGGSGFKVDGGTGFDILNFRVGEAGNGYFSLVAALTAGSAIANVEQVRIEGLSFSDHLIGGASADSMDGNGGDDRLEGRAGDDILYGREGNDLLVGGSGNDLIVGGAGIDTAKFEGFYKQFSVVLGSGGRAIVTGPEGRDSVSEVEMFQFADGTLTFDPEAAFARVLRAYDTVLGRAPDPVGLDYYVDRMEDSGTSLTDVANDLSSSREFQAATGGLTNSAFVDFIYTNALHRAADTGGKAYYTQALDNGMTRGAFVVDLSESTEHRGLTAAQVASGFFNTDDTYQSIALLYDGFANRLPDASGLAYYAERVKSGSMTLAQVTNDFATSVEFKNGIAGKDNGQIVDLIYQNTLDRAPDTVGRAFYQSQLDRGATAAGVLQDIALSAEHYILFSAHITQGIETFGWT